MRFIRTHSKKIAWAALGFVVTIVIIGYAVRVATDLFRVRIPPRSEILAYQLFPISPGWIDLRFWINSEISPNCVRERADLIVPEDGIPKMVEGGDIPKGVAAIGIFLNGMGTGNPGLLPIRYTVRICGDQQVHTRFFYACPVAGGFWPTQVAIQMTPLIHIKFPDCPVAPDVPLGPVVWTHPKVPAAPQ